MASARSRREFLRDATITGASLALLGACSSDSNAPDLELVRLFSSDNVIVAGRPQRLPFGLVDNGAPVVGEGGSVDVRVLLNGDVIDDVVVPSRLVTHDHPDGDGERAARTRRTSSGTSLSGQRCPSPASTTSRSASTVGRSSSRCRPSIRTRSTSSCPGERFPDLDTPTLALPGPMDPLCTLFDGPCPFHEHTVAEVLQAGEPLAFLIATPAYCSTSYCGPVLETLIASAGNFPSIRADSPRGLREPTRGRR